MPKTNKAKRVAKMKHRKRSKKLAERKKEAAKRS